MTAHGLVHRVKRLIRRVQALRPVTIRSGPAAGLRMDLRRTSAWYGRGDNELPVQEAMQSYLRPGQTVLDVGANIGFFSLLAARVVGPSGRVMAFEPVPENADAVLRNARLNQLEQVEVVQAAVGEAPGRLRLHLSRHPGGASLASGAAPADAAGSLEVEVVSLDGLDAAGRLPAPSLIKIDVEGAEMAVLRGARSVLGRYHPIIICEFDGPTPVAIAPHVDEGTSILQGLGYDVRHLAKSYAGHWEVVHVLALPRPVGAP